MSAWLQRFWFASTPPHWAVITRIGFGLVLFVAWLAYGTHLQELFGPAGLGSEATVGRAPEVGGLFDRTLPFGALRRVSNPIGITGAWLVLLGSSLSFAAGVLCRTSGTVALVLHVLFVTRMPFAHWGWASMVVPFMAYTILAQPHRSGVGPRPIWPRRLLQLHVCAMYAITGWARLDQPGWLEGSMVYDALANLMFTRFPGDWRPWIPALSIASWTTYLLEPIAPVLLWLPTLGGWCAAALIAMHVGLEVLTLVDWWNVIMILGLVSFLPDPLLARLAWSATSAGRIEHRRDRSRFD